MAQSTTRVEPNDATHQDCEQLHIEMGRLAFETKVTGNDEVRHHLSSAMYYRESDRTIQQIIQDAVTAANRVWI